MMKVRRNEEMEDVCSALVCGGVESNHEQVAGIAMQWLWVCLARPCSVGPMS